MEFSLNWNNKNKFDENEKSEQSDTEINPIYWGNLNHRRYDLPERECGDWQGRP